MDQKERTVLEPETAGIMKEFFHGWRRKVGCATLALALILMGGWLRSLMFTDIIVAGWDREHLIVASIDASIAFVVEIDHNAGVSTGIFPELLRWETNDFQSLDEDLNADEDFHWVVRCFGFGYVWRDHSSKSSIQIRLIAVPYWSLVLLSTLIAGRLILVPRQENRLDSNKTQSRPPETSTGP